MRTTQITNLQSFMKRRSGLLTVPLLAVFLLCAVTPTVQAQVQDFKVDGIHVILQPSKANQIVSVLVGIEGGYGRGETENPALADITANLTIASGSEKYPKNTYRDELSRLVSSISAGAGSYSTTYSLSCVRPKFDESWNIFSDVIRNPLYDQDELDHLKEQLVTEILGRKAEPEGYASFMVDSIWSAGYRTGRIVEAVDVQAVTTESAKAFHDKEIERSRMTIVVVGDITADILKAKIHKDFGPVKAGTYKHQPFDKILGNQRTDLVVDDRVVPTAYIFGRYRGIGRKDADYFPLLIGALILDDRLYEEVRTKRNLSYAPHSRLGGRGGNYYGSISVSTTMPDSTINVITRELNKIRTEGVTPKELKDRRAEFITEFYMAGQTNLAQAFRLFNAEMETGSWKNALNVLPELNKVTVAQVQAAMAKYLHNVLWTAVGERSKMDRKLFLFQ
jgi:zinc protease